MKAEKKNSTGRKYIVWGIMGIQLIVAIILGVQLFSMNLLPAAYMAGYVIFVLLFNGLTFLAARKTWSSVLMCILSLLLSTVMIYGVVALHKVDNTVEEMSENADEVKTEMVIAVLKESEAQEITDLKQYMIAYVETDVDDTNQVMEEINESVGGEVNYQGFSNITDAVDVLKAKTANAMIVNRAYLDVLEEMEEYAGISEEIKVIYSTEVINYIKLVDETEKNLEQFVVYISGIDTFGDVSVTSRSDVNILVAVNTKTRQVQMINTPRDYFIEFPNSNGVKDKLTHAGMYGVDISMGALEDLYGIEIDYYLRMNFSGFEQIIDALGGIDVYSEYDFTVEPIKHYTVGMNHLSGIEALAFARERKSFALGDIQRGKNQMAVITAMIDKLSSPELLYKYTEVLDAVAGAFQTNMTSEEIYTLVKMQLSDNSKWTIETYSVTGANGSSTMFTLPKTQSYVMIPYEEDVQLAKEKIQAILQTEE